MRNILEFAQRVPNCRIAKLTTNYRSHRAIVERYDHWMASADWSNPNGGSFRHDKTISADPHGQYPDYPSVISIWGRDRRDEAERFADLVEFLKTNEVITDYSQVALLLHSVREDHSGPYLDALKTKGIPAFCPRARVFFNIPEIRDLVACYAVLFGWYGDERGEVAGAVKKLADYVDEAIVHLGKRFRVSAPSRRGCFSGGPARSTRFRRARHSTYVRLTISTNCSRWSRSGRPPETKMSPATLPSFPNS